ncbi:DUF4124 domain-containing protein [Ectothiorhodospiraceae bacterium WFHF3C12]|nr:DUF4124 domain-containing protein [Ectothiorhodospiraceae bacterium WFHF3C12]
MDSAPGRTPRIKPWAAAALSVGVMLAMAGLTPVSAATIYKWTDDTGVTHFSSDPPPAGTDADRIEVESGKRRFGNTPSARVRQIRCRDFRGALDQLDAANVASGERDQWRRARKTAQAGVDKWCRN